MYKWIMVAAMLAVAVLAAWFLLSRLSVTKSQPQDLSQVKSANRGAKKVIFIVVDSLLTEVVDEGLKQGLLPTLRQLQKHGQYHKELVSAFPTMSVAIDSTLITGTYPDQHRVPGLIWYSTERQSLVNYGTGPMEIMTSGVNPVLYNAFILLNGEHLNPSVPTLYEELAQKGLKSGSINGLVYRGAKEHTLTIPSWMSHTTLLPQEIKVMGPDLLSLGIFSNPLNGVREMTDDPFHRLGMNTFFSLETASHLVRQDQLPDFLYVYLPDLDKPLHKKGPSQLGIVEEVDRQLGQFLAEFGSLEEAREKATFVLIGDSGVTQIKASKEEAIVPLYELLGDYRILEPGTQVSDETEIVFAVNETMAYVYKLKSELSSRDVAQKLSKDSRIDFVSWKERDTVHVLQAVTGKELRYARSGPYVDTYKQSWTLTGDGEVLDLRIDDARGTLHYGDYPDGLQRLWSALHSHEGEFMVVTAKPGYELADRSSPTHQGGGAHGSLHRIESLIPLFIYGTELQPEHLRVVDLKNYLLKLVSAYQETHTRG